MIGNSRFGNNLVNEARSWKSTPFYHNIRKKGHGADCLGLILGTWEIVNDAHFEKELIYPPPSKYCTNHTNLEINFDEITEVVSFSNILIGDVICFQLSKCQYHLAFYSRRNDVEMLIHSRMNIGVTEETYSQFWKSKARKVFRLMEM